MNRTSVRVRFLVFGVLLALVLALVPVVPPAAEAAFNHPQPANGAGELVDSFNQDDAIFVIGLSDLGGGRVCIIPAGGAADCDDPANMGPPNVLIGIGTVYSLIAGPRLLPGDWQLLSESGSSGNWSPNHVSDVFTVFPCEPGACPPSTGAEDAERFKAASREATRGASAVCTAFNVRDVATAGRDYVKKSTVRNGVTLIETVRTALGDDSGGSSGDFGVDIPPPPLWEWMLRGIACNVQQMHKDIELDPPDPNFTSVEQPQFQTVPAGLGSPALQEYVEAMEEQRAYGRAILRAYERYQGAQAANSLEYEAMQIRAVSDFSRDFERALVRSADASAALAGDGDAASRAWTDPVVFPTTEGRDGYAAFARRVAASGYTPAEESLALAAGWTEEQIAEVERSYLDFEEVAHAPGASSAATLRYQAEQFREAAIGVDQFGRDTDAVANGLEGALAPPLDASVASIDLTASDETARTGDEVCLEAVPRRADGSAIGGGPMTVRLDSTGDLDFDQTRPNMYNHYGTVMTECFTFGHEVDVTFRVRVGSAADSVTVTWRDPAAGDHAPWTQRTSVEVKPGESTPIILSGGDDEGHPLTWQVTSSPQLGTLSGEAPNLVYTADAEPERNGEVIRFRVSDGTRTVDGDVQVYVGADAVAPGLPVVSVDAKGATTGRLPYRQPAPESLRDEDIIDVAGGGQSGSFALDADGDVHAWGGYDWMSGPGVTPEVIARNWVVPERIAALDVAAIRSDGSGYNVAIADDGTLHAWGDCLNDIPRSLLGVPVDDVEVSVSNGIALLTDGSLSVWNRGWYGGHGDPDSTCALGEVPVPPRFATSDFVAVDSGGLQATALRGDGEIVSWFVQHGDYAYPWATMTSTDPFVTVDADLYEVWATTASGSFFGWAGNLSGTHNFAGSRRLAGDAVARIESGFGHAAPLFGLAEDGSLRTLRFESPAGVYYPDNSGGLPQELLGRRVTDMSSAQLGGLALAPAMTVERHAGRDRYATGVEISKEGFGPGVPVVYLATGANYPDALSAAPAAAIEGGPLLLTAPTALPAAVAAELDRLEPDRIVVVGGFGAVSRAVESRLEEYAPVVDRIAGADRYATSRALVSSVFDDVDDVFLATGRDFPDALSASSAAATAGAPVLLVDGKGAGVPEPLGALVEELGAQRVLITGGTGAVSEMVADAAAEIPGIQTVTRLAGASRYATSVAINRHAFADSEELFLATGTGFADALAGAALAGARQAPLYVIPKTCVPADVAGEALRLRVLTSRVLGGTGALAAPVEEWQMCPG
ncbi:cell wall-binding repeat-containing protein [Microbacterium aoyamense]|nr:cell wall-binding repeat-containing protein [Microbacterium aoyamense]